MLAQMQEMRRQLQASQQREAQKKVHHVACVCECRKRVAYACQGCVFLTDPSAVGDPPPSVGAFPAQHAKTALG